MAHDTLPESSGTTDQLLDVAQELAQTRGYNAFSYRDLRGGVGIRSAEHPPSLSRQSRIWDEHSLRAIRERFSDALRRIAAGEATRPPSLPPTSSCSARRTSRGPGSASAGMFASDLPTLPAEVQEQVRGFYTDNEAWLTRLLDAGRRSSELDFEGNPRDAAAALLDGLEGALLAARAHGTAARFTRASRWLLLSVGARS